MRRAVVASILAASTIAGCGPGHTTVDMTIHLSRFAPRTLEVRAGATVTFVIENTDPIAHEFILGDEDVQRRHERGTEPSHGAVPGEVSIPAGATRSTTYTFDQPGTLEFACHLPGHFAYGMRGEVQVSA